MKAYALEIVLKVKFVSDARDLCLSIILLWLEGRKKKKKKKKKKGKKDINFLVCNFILIFECLRTFKR